MTRGQRRVHLIAWLLLVPVLALVYAIGTGEFGTSGTAAGSASVDGGGSATESGKSDSAVLERAAEIAGEGSP